MARKRKAPEIEAVEKRKTVAPGYLRQFYERDGTREKRALHAAINRITNAGLRNLTREQVKQLGLPLIREAKVRMRELEAHGLTMTSAYKYVKEAKVDLSTSGKDIRTIKNNVRIAYDFLHAKTSIVQYAQEQKEWIESHIGLDLTEDENTAIWDVIHRFESLVPGKFIDFGYDEQIRKIADVVKASAFDTEKATAELCKYYNITKKELEQGVELEGDTSGWEAGRHSY